VSAHGQRLADARVTLREPVADPFTVFNRPTALLRYFPRLVKGQHDKPAVNELTVSITDDLKLLSCGAAKASSLSRRCPVKSCTRWDPSRSAPEFRYGLSYSVTDLEIVQDFTK